MEESSSQIPPSLKMTLKDKHEIQDRPESPNPFLLVDQVEFNFDEMILSTKNEVALL
ncbi:hypothetical protein Tco_0495445, partial [Tanacetum coccineum]